MLIFVQYSIDKSVAIFTIFANCTSEIKLFAGTYNSMFFYFIEWPLKFTTNVLKTN